MRKQGAAKKSGPVGFLYGEPVRDQGSLGL